MEPTAQEDGQDPAPIPAQADGQDQVMPTAQADGKGQAMMPTAQAAGKTQVTIAARVAAIGRHSGTARMVGLSMNGIPHSQTLNLMNHGDQP